MKKQEVQVDHIQLHWVNHTLEREGPRASSSNWCKSDSTQWVTKKTFLQSNMVCLFILGEVINTFLTESKAAECILRRDFTWETRHTRLLDHFNARSIYEKKKLHHIFLSWVIHGKRLSCSNLLCENYVLLIKTQDNTFTVVYQWAESSNFLLSEHPRWVILIDFCRKKRANNLD